MGAGEYGQMAAQIIGTELQGWAAILEQQQMQQALADEMARQRRLQNIGTTQLRGFLPSLSAESATQQLGRAAATRQGEYQAAQQPLTATGPGMSKADIAQLNLAGQQRAGLGSYGDWLSNQAVATDKMQDVINRIGTRAHGLAQVFPYSLDAAQHSQDMLNAIGAAIGSLGGSGINWSQLYSRQQPNTQYPGPGTGGAGVDQSAYTNPYANVA